MELFAKPVCGRARRRRFCVREKVVLPAASSGLRPLDDLPDMRRGARMAAATAEMHERGRRARAAHGSNKTLPFGNPLDVFREASRDLAQLGFR